MLLRAFNETGYLEQLTGLDQLYEEGQAAYNIQFRNATSMYRYSQHGQSHYTLHALRFLDRCDLHPRHRAVHDQPERSLHPRLVRRRHDEIPPRLQRARLDHHARDRVRVRPRRRDVPPERARARVLVEEREVERERRGGRRELQAEAHLSYGGGRDQQLVRRVRGVRPRAWAPPAVSAVLQLK